MIAQEAELEIRILKTNLEDIKGILEFALVVFGCITKYVFIHSQYARRIKKTTPFEMLAELSASHYIQHSYSVTMTLSIDVISCIAYTHGFFHPTFNQENHRQAIHLRRAIMKPKKGASNNNELAKKLN